MFLLPGQPSDVDPTHMRPKCLRQVCHPAAAVYAFWRGVSAPGGLGRSSVWPAQNGQAEVRG